MYIVPDILELQFPQVSQGYFHNKSFSPEDNLNILCNWICFELISKGRSWLSIREELKLEDNNSLEPYFYRATGFNPRDFAEYWGKRG